MNKPMGNRVRTMTQLALLLALLLILSYTPLGYLPVGPLVLSLLSVPVAIGAMLLGPLGGAVLGGAFGLTSFFNMMRGSSPMGAALFCDQPGRHLCALLCLPRGDGGLLRAGLSPGMQAAAPAHQALLCSRRAGRAAVQHAVLYGAARRAVL